MEDLLDFLIDELIEAGASDDEIEEYRDNWPGEDGNIPVPCPLCFINEDSIEKLVSLPEEDGCEPMRCKNCRTVFYKPIED